MSINTIGDMIKNGEMNLKNGGAYSPSLVIRMMMRMVMMWRWMMMMMTMMMVSMMKNGAYSPSLMNRVKDIDSRHCSRMATPNCHYFASLDCLVMINVIVIVIVIEKDD